MATAPPPPIVQRALDARPFKATSTRRDLSTTLRAFKAAWTALEQAEVLSKSCRRLGERAAEVLLGVVEVLKAVDEQEKAAQEGKVVLERTYEFRREPSSPGEQGGAMQSGTTVFKTQSVMLDAQMFATNFLALSSTSRLDLLVDGLPAQQRNLHMLAASLAACIALYGVSSPSSASWPPEDADDLSLDTAALPRLFQLSIALRGPTHDAFLAQSSPSLAQATPANRRTAFIDFCYDRNPLLKPTPREGSASPGAPRKGRPKVSWPPAQGEGVGLGIPGVGKDAPAEPKRAVSQPVPATPGSPSPTASAPAALSPPRASVVEAPPLAEPGPSAEQSSPPPPAPALALPPSEDLPPSPSPASAPSPPFSSPSPPTVALAASLTPLTTSTTKPAIPADEDPHLSLGRRESSASSVAMTATSSAGSRLFEGAEVVEEEEEEEEGEEAPGEGKVGEAQQEEEREEPREETKKQEVEEPAHEEPMELSPPPPVERQPVEEHSVSVVEAEPPALADEAAPSQDEARAAPLEPEQAVEASALPQDDSVADAAEPQVDSAPSPVVHGAEAAAPSVPTITLTEEPASIDEPASPAVVVSAPEPLEDEKPAVESVPVVSAPTEVETPAPATAVAASSPPPAAAFPTVVPTPPSPPYRVLSLDGCGLVGLIPQLLLLQQHLSSLPGSPSPADHFDLIVGTSTSALLTVLLGHSKLSIPDALAVYTRIAEKAFPLELPVPEGAPRRKQKSGFWSRLFGGGGNGGTGTTSPPPQVASEPVRRQQALEAALKAHLPGATARFAASTSGESCRVAVLAFERVGASGRERWITNEDGPHGLSVAEVVKASLGATSFFPSFGAFMTSPTSLNPSSAALSLLDSSSAPSPSSGQPISLLSLGSGYASLSLDPSTTRRLSRARLAALKGVKQLAASNAVAAAALAEKVKKEKGRVEVVRLEVDCSRCGIEAVEEWRTVEAVRGRVSGGLGGGRMKSEVIALAPAAHSPSPALLAPSSLPPPSSPTASPKPLRKRLSFFNSLGSGNSSPSRRASSFVAPSTDARDAATPASPTSPISAARPISLAPPPSRGLRPSVSLDDMARREFASGGRGMYGVREAAESTGSLSG
ncbi:hypothetical protein JCM10207_000295 [Rhodosporidiobolus poonsookiae]